MADASSRQPGTWHYRGRDHGVKACCRLRVELLLVRGEGRGGQARQGRWKSLRVAYTSSYIRRLVLHEIERNDGGGPPGRAMRQRHAASSILYKHIICLLRGWTGDLTPGRMLHFFSAFTHRVSTYGYSGGSPLPSSVPTRGHDRQLVAAPRLKRGPYLTRGGCEGCKLRVRCCKTERIQSPRLSGSNRQVWTFFPFLHPPALCAEQSVGREGEREGARMTTANNSLYIDTKPCGSPSTHHSMLYFVVAPRGTHAERRVPGRPPSRGAPPGMHRQA